MGSRLSQPRGPAGTTESSLATKPPGPPTPTKPWNGRRINSRTLTAPLAAFTMACLLFVYARTSIRAAKHNAQRHRQMDSGGDGGGGLSLLNEHYRRHGMAERVDKNGGGKGVAVMGGTVGELVGEVRREFRGGKGEKGEGEGVGGGMERKSGRSEEEERLRALRGQRVGRRGVEEG